MFETVINDDKKVQQIDSTVGDDLGLEGAFRFRIQNEDGDENEKICLYVEFTSVCNDEVWKSSYISEAHSYTMYFASYRVNGLTSYNLPV